MLEAHAVLTDARRVAAPLAPRQAWAELEGLAHMIPVVGPERQALYELARVIDHRLPRAQEVFDSFLVAQMRAAGIGTICTYNVGDFERCDGIDPERPEAILARFGVRD
ncbi:MAG: hypothetical protein ACT4P5_14325 [Armatimonadota bacterium]